MGESDSKDGGKLQLRLWENGDEVEADVLKDIEETKSDWLAHAIRSRWYSTILAEYFGNAAYTLPKGPSLEQKIGQRGADENGNIPPSDTGSAPFARYEALPSAVQS